MAVDNREAKRTLEELVMTMHAHRSAEAEYRKKEDDSGVVRCELALKLDYILVREYCAKHGLDVPHDVPPSGEG